MSDLLVEPLGELLGLAVYALVAGALTVVGSLTELAGVRDIAAGSLAIGLWEAAFGAVLLYAALTVAKNFVLDPFLGSSSDEA